MRQTYICGVCESTRLPGTERQRGARRANLVQHHNRMHLDYYHELSKEQLDQCNQESPDYVNPLDRVVATPRHAQSMQ